MIKINKKSNATFVFVITLISIIGFFVMFNFFMNTSNIVSSESQDILCKSLVSIKDKSKLGLGVYLYELNNKCKVDSIKIDNKDKDSTFEPIAQTMKRCWNKYGEGKNDLMSNYDTTGEWCFKCADISYNDENGKIYNYDELVNWMKENKFKTKDGKSSYFDYLNIMSNNDNKNQIKNKDMQLAISNDNSENLKEFENFYLGNQESILDFSNNYKFKKINPQEKNFVVLRFIRIEKGLINDFVDFGAAFLTQSATYSAYSIVKNPIKSTKNSVNLIKNIKNPSGILEGDKSTIKYTSSKGNNGEYKIKSYNKNTGEYTLKNTKGTRNTFTLGKEKSKLLEKQMKTSKKVGKLFFKTLKKNKIAAAVIGTISTVYALENKNYIQYIDILNQEQYYRQCGTQRFSK